MRKGQKYYVPDFTTGLFHTEVWGEDSFRDEWRQENNLVHTSTATAKAAARRAREIYLRVVERRNAQ